MVQMVFEPVDCDDRNAMKELREMGKASRKRTKYLDADQILVDRPSLQEEN
ncbi:hypothetical protein PM082_009698 [Marasmius tenuissimus]|nr:hypothetical protein PM082_009698 [Marasmius tenuissimus]